MLLRPLLILDFPFLGQNIFYINSEKQCLEKEKKRKGIRQTQVNWHAIPTRLHSFLERFDHLVWFRTKKEKMRRGGGRWGWWRRGGTCPTPWRHKHPNMESGRRAQPKGTNTKGRHGQPWSTQPSRPILANVERVVNVKVPSVVVIRELIQKVTNIQTIIKQHQPAGW